MKEKEKKIDSRLRSYVTTELKTRNIAYRMDDHGPYCIVHLNIASALWNEIVKDARYHLVAEQETNEQSCYLPVVSIHTVKNGAKMRKLQSMFHTRCFFIEEGQHETLKYLYA